MPIQRASRKTPWIPLFEAVSGEIYVQTLQNQIHTEGVRSQTNHVTKIQGNYPKYTFPLGCCGFLVGHVSIFDAWLCLTFQIVPMPINTAFMDLRRGFREQ